MDHAIINLTVKDQQEKVLKRIANYELQLKLINIILKGLKKFEGKKITKHIETYFKKELPDYYISLSDQNGMYHLNVTPKQFLNDQEYYFKPLLGYAGQKRIPKIQKGLKEIEKLIACKLDMDYDFKLYK